MAGPSRIPTEELLRRGSWRGIARAKESMIQQLVAIERAKDEAPPEALATPAWLNADGKATFQKLAMYLTEMRVLAVTDYLALAMLSDAVATYIQAAKLLETGNLVLSTGDGRAYANPAVSIRDRAWQNVMRGCAQFGLTPSSRNGLSFAKSMVGLTGPRITLDAKKAAEGKQRLLKLA